MKFISIDVETTGLDSEWCQVLEIGAVAWEIGKGQIGKPFQCLLKHEKIVGDPYALWMNRDLLRILADNPRELVPPESVACLFRDWRNSLDKVSLDFMGSKPFNAAGKNFASFDAGFLKKLLGFFELNPWRRRILDPSILYVETGDKTLPDTATCLTRCGHDSTVAHMAVEDALTVCHLLEAKLA
ncbi:MAG: 3'-5' exonuclease [Deltaproteobacteria bacterium]|nr:3'-5' exonuclease [Deltaproteobacteria bacterium]